MYILDKSLVRWAMLVVGMAGAEILEELTDFGFLIVSVSASTARESLLTWTVVAICS